MVDLRAEIVVIVEFEVHPSVRALADQIGDCFTYPSIASDKGTHCHSGSSWQKDKDIGLELDSPTRSPVPLHHLVELVSMVRLYAGVDYVRGIRALMTSGSLYSVFPLARSALEAFAYVSWIWKPALVQELRVNRALLDHKSSLEQEKRRLKGLLNITERDGDTHHAARVKSDIALSTDDYTTACHDLRMVETYINQRHGAGSVQTRPSATRAVSALLAKATQSRSMDAIYGELSELVHPQPSGIMPLLSESRVFNITLGNFLMPIHASMLGLHQCLDDISACWGLPEPWQYMSGFFEVLQDARLNNLEDELLIVASP